MDKRLGSVAFCFEDLAHLLDVPDKHTIIDVVVDHETQSLTAILSGNKMPSVPAGNLIKRIAVGTGHGEIIYTLK